MNTRRSQRGFAAARVLEPGVAAIDEHIASFQERLQLLDGRVNRLPGRDHYHDAPRARQRRGELFEGRCALELCAGMLRDEVSDPVGFEIPHSDAGTVRFDVERQVAPHRAKSDDPEIRSAHRTLLDAATSRSNATSRTR